jgi:hypothetical protein
MNRIKTLLLAATLILALSFIVRSFLAEKVSNPLSSEAVAQTEDGINPMTALEPMPKRWGKVLQMERGDNAVEFLLQADDGTPRLVTWEPIPTKGNSFAMELRQIILFERK